MRAQLLRFFFGLYFLLLRLVRGKSVGVRAIVLSPNETEILLVYHTYCPNWHLPGGGVNSREHPIEAVQRELFEETGVQCLESPVFFGIYYQKYRGADDYPVVYIVRQWTQETVKSPEIKESRWFSIKDLPTDMDPGSLARIHEYLKGHPSSHFWKPGFSKLRSTS